MASLPFGFRGDQIGQGFCLEKVYLSIHEGTTSKFPSLGEPDAFEVRQRRQQSSNRRLAAMEVELCAILASKALRRREEEQQSCINDFSTWCPESPVGRGPRGREGASNRFDGESSSWSRYPKHRNPGRKPPAGKGYNRVRHVDAITFCRAKRPTASWIPCSIGAETPRPGYVFIESKKSALVFVCFSLSMRNSMASVVPIGARILRRTNIFCRSDLGTRRSSLRVPDLRISIAG